MKTARVLMLCTAAMAGACHRDPATPQPPKPAPHVALPVAAVKTGPTAADQTAGMVEAVSLGKSQLPVKLKFDLPQRPKPGEPLDVNLAVMAEIDASEAAIQVTGGDGLAVATGAAQVDLPAIEAGQVYRQSVRVTPGADGLLVLGLTISLKHDEVSESRAFSIPLIVER